MWQSRKPLQNYFKQPKLHKLTGDNTALQAYENAESTTVY